MARDRRRTAQPNPVDRSISVQCNPLIERIGGTSIGFIAVVCVDMCKKRSRRVNRDSIPGAGPAKRLLVDSQDKRLSPLPIETINNDAHRRVITYFVVPYLVAQALNIVQFLQYATTRVEIRRLGFYPPDIAGISEASIKAVGIAARSVRDTDLQTIFNVLRGLDREIPSVQVVTINNH